MHGVYAEATQQGEKDRCQDQGGGNNIHEHTDNQQQNIDREEKNPGGLNILNHSVGDLPGDLLKGQVLAKDRSTGDNHEQG